MPTGRLFGAEQCGTEPCAGLDLESLQICARPKVEKAVPEGPLRFQEGASVPHPYFQKINEVAPGILSLPVPKTLWQPLPGVLVLQWPWLMMWLTN